MQFTTFSLLLAFSFCFSYCYCCTISMAEWQTVTSIPSPHVEGATASINGKLYIMGGFQGSDEMLPNPTTHIYDVATNTWSQGADLPIAVTHIQAAVYLNRYIILPGGFIGKHPGNATKQVWRYDIQTNSFERMIDLPELRASGGVVVDHLHHLHYFGGLKDRNEDTNTHWILDLKNSTATWQNGTPFAADRRRNHFQAVQLGPKIFLVGGQHFHDDQNVLVDINLVDSYNLLTDEWVSGPDLPSPRSHAETATMPIYDNIVAFGGRNFRPPESNVLNTGVVYSYANNSWSQLRSLPGPRITPFAGFFKNISIADKGLGDYLVVTAGGVDYNRASFETWISRIECTGEILTWNLTTPSLSSSVVPAPSILAERSFNPRTSQGIIAPTNSASGVGYVLSILISFVIIVL